jgi:transposase
MGGKRGKNDAAEAQAICEAVQRPNMRLVPVKSQDKQARLSIHRVRKGFVEQRTATINRIRGLLMVCVEAPAVPFPWDSAPLRGQRASAATRRAEIP